MRIEPLTRRDFRWILDHFDRFWDDDATRPRHHPMFVHEFADTAFAIRDGGDRDDLAAYLLGFVATASPTAYVHMVAVERSYRRKGLARALYEHFIDIARERGCRRLKATAAPENRHSIAFHTAFGMATEGEPSDDGVGVVREYGGPGIDRVIFTMDI